MDKSQAQRDYDCYSEKARNLGVLLVFNLLVAAFTWFAPDPGGDQFRVIAMPAVVLALDFALMYAMCQEAGDGWLTGLGCGVCFACIIFPMLVAADLGHQHTGQCMAVGVVIGCVPIYFVRRWYVRESLKKLVWLLLYASPIATTPADELPTLRIR